MLVLIAQKLDLQNMWNSLWKTVLRSSFDLWNKKWGLTSYFLRKTQVTAKKARFRWHFGQKTCFFGSKSSFSQKSSSSPPIFHSINQKMTSIPSSTTNFTNFVGSFFAQLKLEHIQFYKNWYFSMKTALYATFKQ